MARKKPKLLSSVIAAFLVVFFISTKAPAAEKPATLEQLHLDERTVVIFTSDNGGDASITNNAPLRAGKGWVYEGGIRVPLVIKWPGRVQPGSICTEPVTSEDLYPTIVQIAGRGAMPGKNLDGQTRKKR